jgi:hypothetical protein
VFQGDLITCGPGLLSTGKCPDCERSIDFGLYVSQISDGDGLPSRIPQRGFSAGRNISGRVNQI